MHQINYLNLNLILLQTKLGQESPIKQTARQQSNHWIWLIVIISLPLAIKRCISDNIEIHLFFSPLFTNSIKKYQIKGNLGKTNV